MFVHDTHKGSSIVTGMSPESVESSSSNKPKMEPNSPKTSSSNVRCVPQLLDNFKTSCYLL
jgi:hypothetical protein